MERDPRVDPQPGDVLHFASSTFTVLSVSDRVIYNISGWHQASLPLSSWRQYSEKWTVIKTAAPAKEGRE